MNSFTFSLAILLLVLCGFVQSERISSSSFTILPWNCYPHQRWTEYVTKVKTEQKKYKDCGKNCYQSLIESDLKVFKQKGITQESLRLASTRSPVRYQIIGGILYRTQNCNFPARCSGIEHFIKKILSSSTSFPDLEMVVNVSDYPKVSIREEAIPVFSFSKDGNYQDITYPPWTFWEGGPAITLAPRGLGRWDLAIPSMNESAKKWPWSKKIDKAFFRGSRTSGERDKLVYLSRSMPNLFNASYTKNQAWKSEADTLGPPNPEISLENHCEFRYLFNFRGVAASFRFKYLFLCNSLVFHVGDEWIEFFYPEMKPWVHYIPVKQDLSNALELVQFASENDDLAKRIAQKGQQFITLHLRMEDVENYWRNLLKSYAELLTFRPTLDSNLIRI